MKRQFILTVNFLALMLFSSMSYLNASENVTQNDPNESTELSDDSIMAAKIDNMRIALIGRWENPYFISENPSIKNGSLRYQFRENGTYSKVLGGSETRIEEEGTWEISADGKHLLMRSQSLCNGQQVAVTNVAAIKHLQLDELVLEQALCVDGVNVSAEPKDFFFNKY
ncbi:MAG: hypothetical protein IPJ74_03540 [Saprospiraceae bacterium]|nr:hypothetical protein [Saprospiraceae bacterium]